MERNGSKEIVCSLLILGVVILSRRGGVEGKESFRTESACFGDTLHLDCGKRSFVAVHAATFSSPSNLSCRSPTPAGLPEYIEDGGGDNDTAPCTEDIRISVNRRCSGNKNCNYSYSQVPDRICNNHEGSFTVRYDCVREPHLNKYCSTKVQSREGYITSPGYPQYYPQLSECSWALTAQEGQTILAKVLHLHLREATVPKPTPADPDAYYPFGVQIVPEEARRCDEDRLSVVEGTSNKHFEVCGESLSALRTIEADGAAGLEIRFRSSGFNPASGFLLYFKIHGCPTLPAKDGSHLVERNGSTAVYACQNHQVFNDTLESTRVLQCVDDRYWNNTLTTCTAVDEMTTVANFAVIYNTTEHDDFENETTGGIFDFDINALIDKNADLWADVIIPVLIICGLLLGNIAILVFIFIVRRRQKHGPEEFDTPKASKTVKIVEHIEEDEEEES